MNQFQQLPKRKSISKSSVVDEKDKNAKQASLQTEWALQYCNEEPNRLNTLQQQQAPKMEAMKASQANAFMKIKDINENTREYSVLVKVLRSMQLQSNYKDRDYVKVVLADQTACVNGFFKGENCQFFKVGNVLAIKKGFVRVIKGHIELQLSDCGRIMESNAKVNENTDHNISAAQIRFGRYRNHHNERGRNHYSRRRSQYRAYNNYNRYEEAKPQYKQQYHHRQPSSRKYQHVFQQEGHKTKSRNGHQEDHGVRRQRNVQEKYQSKEKSITYLLRKPTSSREEALSSHQLAQKNKYFKIYELKQAKEQISVVGRIRHIQYRQINYILVTLQDETGNIKAYLPNSQLILKGNILVLHNLLCKFKQSKYVLMAKQDTVVSRARMNLQPILNMYK